LLKKALFIIHFIVFMYEMLVSIVLIFTCVAECGDWIFIFVVDLFRVDNFLQFHKNPVCLKHRLSIDRPTKRGKEKSPSDGYYQCQKEMDDDEYLLAC
jgi:hypothetical protein